MCARKILKILLSLSFLDKFYNGEKCPLFLPQMFHVCIPFIKTRRVRSTWINYNVSAAEWRIFDIFTLYFTHSSRRFSYAVSRVLILLHILAFHMWKPCFPLFAPCVFQLVSDIWTRTFDVFSTSLPSLIYYSAKLCLLFGCFHPAYSPFLSYPTMHGEGWINSHRAVSSGFADDRYSKSWEIASEFA